MCIRANVGVRDKAGTHGMFCRMTLNGCEILDAGFSTELTFKTRLYVLPLRV